jgi:hypothetical protein
MRLAILVLLMVVAPVMAQSTAQEQAVKSCIIKCCNDNLGTWDDSSDLCLNLNSSGRQNVYGQCASECALRSAGTQVPCMPSLILGATVLACLYFRKS